MRYAIEVEQEEDGRWLAEISDLPGVLTYGSNRHEAIANVKALGSLIPESRSA